MGLARVIRLEAKVSLESIFIIYLINIKLSYMEISEERKLEKERQRKYADRLEMLKQTLREKRAATNGTDE